MNIKKKKEIAKKRIQSLFSSNLGSNNKEFPIIKWDINKEFNLNFHDKASSEFDIILNPDTFQGVQENDFLEIISASNSDLRILFKIKKQNLDKIKTPISILSVYNELIKNQNENYNKSSVYVRPANISDYFVDKITILFKEQFISRKDIFQITQALIDTTIYINKDIKLVPNPDNDENPVAEVVSFKGTKQKIPVTGLVTSSTDFELRSLASGIFFLVEISKDTYDFSISCKTKFELIIEFLKNTMQKLKESRCSHTINIIFFSRIYFQKNEKRKLIKKKCSYSSIYNENVGDFIYQSDLFKDEYFFDIYSNVIKLNVGKLDMIEMVNKLYKAFNAFASIFKVSNLSDYMNELKLNFDLNLNLIGLKKGNSSIETKESGSTFFLNDITQFNNFFSPKFFEDVESFRMSKSVTSNLFEAFNVIINELKIEKKKMYKLGNIISVISSGEYFPYYNGRLAKITKENLHEQGIACCMVFLCSRNKVVENYKIKMNSCNDHGNDVHFFNREDRHDRNQSFYSHKDFSTDENIKLEIAKNNVILGNFCEIQCQRKNSLDNIYKTNTSIPTYRNGFDVFTHIVPKWLKTFFISNYTQIHKTVEKIINKEIFPPTPTFSSLASLSILNNPFPNKKQMRKMSSITLVNNFTVPEDLDTDIFNAKKKTDPSQMKSKFDKDDFDEDYENLGVSDNRKISCLNDDQADEDTNTDEVFNLSKLEEKLNIYKLNYIKSKTSKKESNDDELDTSISSPLVTCDKRRKAKCKKNSNDDLNDEEKEFNKKAKEYENEIFVNKSSRKNCISGMKHEKSECLEKKPGCRLILNAFEFTETDDEFLLITELLSQVPLLPLFGEFDPNCFKEEFSMAPHQLSSLNSDYNFWEEIIFERINNNYKINKQKSHSEVYNKKIDLKTIQSIHLFDRRSNHMISVEDQNYKVQIYNNLKKLTKYVESEMFSRKTADGKRFSCINEANLSYLEYNYFVYDPKVNLLIGKRTSTELGEKNEVFWSKYDILLNDLQLNMKKIKFKNESNFLILGRNEDNSKKKRQKIRYYEPYFGLWIRDTYNTLNNEFSSSTSFMSHSHTKDDSESVNSDSSNFINILNLKEESFKERSQSYFNSVQNYLTKYMKFNHKISNKTFNILSNEQNVDAMKNILKYSLLVVNTGVDWILFVHNKYFNERNILFMSIKWLSCNGIAVSNFHKNIARNSKLKNLGLVKIPCDEVQYTNFKRVSLWKLNYLSSVKILDEFLSLGIFYNFLRCEFDNNLIFLNEDKNLLCKISQSGLVFLHDEMIEQCNYCQSSFVETALKLDAVLDLFDYMNDLLDKVEAYIL